MGKTKVKQIKLPIEEQCDEEIKECGDGLGRAAPAGGGASLTGKPEELRKEQEKLNEDGECPDSKQPG